MPPMHENRDGRHCCGYHRVDVLVLQDALELLFQFQLPALGGFEFRARLVPDCGIQIAEGPELSALIPDFRLLALPRRLPSGRPLGTNPDQGGAIARALWIDGE